MRTFLIAIAALLAFAPRVTAKAATGLFTCRIGTHTVSVTDDGGRLTYRYGTPGKDEMSISAAPKSGRVLQLQQRFAGMEYQLRFKNGEISYIVYSMEGNGQSGAAAVSGLKVMKGIKELSDKFCSPYAELTLPPDSEDVPQDSDAYSAM